MDIPKETSFEALAQRQLGTGFPPLLAGAVSLADMRPEVRGFTLRMLDLMKRSRYSITQFNPMLTRWLATTIPSILPGAWRGHIPPITGPGRHKKLDDYVAGHKFPDMNAPPVFMDIGCGFPPATTADSASRFPDWSVYGIDPSFPDYMVYDADGHYACFDRGGRLLYFQPSTKVGGKALYAAPGQTIHRFNRLFRDLCPLLKNERPLVSESVEKNGTRLVHHPIMDFEKNNLGFIESDLGDLGPMKARVVRCMNLFLYLNNEQKNEGLRLIKDRLDRNGLLIVGTNGFGIQLRYAVYKKRSEDLRLHEFAFSLDNLGHLSLIPWFTIHDNDPEALLLAQLLGIIRSARAFWTSFSSHLDQLLEDFGICARKADGVLHFHEKEIRPQTFLEKNALLWREMQENGYLDGAVDVLKKAGRTAWINPAGDIAVRPQNYSFTGAES